MAKISSSTVSELKAQIDNLTKDPSGAPGIVYCAVNKNGDSIFEHASGKVGVGQSEDMSLETVFWIASCTKMITGIAAMQLAENGTLGLDDVEALEMLAPELSAVQVIDGKKLVAKNKRITMRMLLSHTAGFGYSFFDERLNNFYHPGGLDEFSGLESDVLPQPLVNQPGSAWEYGINIDWAGELIMRASGMSLNEYFVKNIFTPLGIANDITMFPNEEMKGKLACMNMRDAQSGKLSLNPNGHLQRAALLARSQKEREAVFNSGGAGCFARPKAYCQIIATLLNDGVHPGSGNRILKAETVKEMFTNQVPDFPNFGRNAINPPKLLLSNPLPELYPEPHDIPQGWGLTFFLHLREGQVHSEGTGWWAGLPNLFWWCDRSRGIGGIIASQILPFGDPKVMGLWGGVQAGILGGLEK